MQKPNLPRPFLRIFHIGIIKWGVFCYTILSMIRSRLARNEEKKEQHRIYLAFGGIIVIVVLFLVFGVKLLVAFSLFVDKVRGTTPKTTEQAQVILIPPELDPLSEATNSAEIVVTGRAKDAPTVILYLNDEKTMETKLKEDGTFRFTGVGLSKGKNTIAARTGDDKNNTSEASETLFVEYKKGDPILELSAPSDNAEISGEKAITTVTGKTDAENTVRINDRLVVVQNDGSFSYDYPLKEGDQTLTIIARDTAGNQTKVERKVKYKK